MKSYNEIITTCKAFAYEEGPQWRKEVWQDNGCQWICKWFYSNDGAMPNTIVRKNNEIILD